MALRKPLVIDTNGLLEELPASDTLDAQVVEVDVFNLTNGEASTQPPGTPVYVSAANTFLKANPAAVNSANVFGILKASTTSGSSGPVQSNGALSLSTGQWDAVTGASGGLTAGDTYYLDTTAGTLTNTTPSSNWIVKVGTAISTTVLSISPAIIAKKA